MTCDRIQAAVSRAIDEGRGLAPFEGHLSACPDCGGFAESSRDLATRYRRRVLLGIERLRLATPPPPRRRPRVRGLIPLAAAALVLWSVPLGKPAASPPVPAPTASARVPLFDAIPSDAVDLPAAAWFSEPPLPKRLDEELSGPIAFDLEPAVALPTGLRF